MSLQAQLMEEMKTAMKAHDQDKLGVIRFLRAAIKNYEIDNGEADDEAVMKVIAQQVKQTKESIEEYGKGGRDDLVAEEKKKLEIMEAYLPAQMSDDELKAIIDEVVAGLDAPQMGPVIGQVMKRVGTQADGSRVSQLVREALS